MIFGPLEIFLCLAPFMLFTLAIGLGLFAQNLALDRREQFRGLIRCPYCRKGLNPEAYICRFCRKELYDYTNQ